MITYDAPTVDGFAALERQMTEERAQHMIDAGTKFVCHYQDGDLTGLLWFVGTGIHWWTVGIVVRPDVRRQGIGKQLRQAMITWCEENTVGVGHIVGFYEEGITPFWDDMLGTATHRKMRVGTRRIDGTFTPPTP